MGRIGLKAVITVFALLFLMQTAQGLELLAILEEPGGAGQDSRFGRCVKGIGDINEDGYDDIIVSAPFSTGGSKCYIYYGGPDWDTLPDMILTRGLNGRERGNLGASIAPGDVDGDGHLDLLVGTLSGPPGGEAFLYFGGPGMDSLPDMRFKPRPEDSAYAYFGDDVAAGDVNGDDTCDIVIGAGGSDAAGIDFGRVYVFFGGANLDTIADFSLFGSFYGHYFGGALGIEVGDVNGDEEGDLVVGASAWPTSQPGWVYVYFGGPGLDTTVDLTFEGKSSGEEFGDVVELGDITGDSGVDLTVYAWDNGLHYFYWGGSLLDTTVDLTIQGRGRGMDIVPDVTGDSWPDFTVERGWKVYVYEGGPVLDTVPDDSMSVPFGNVNDFGYSISSAGDFNADGGNDLLVGAPYYDYHYPYNARVYVYKGVVTGLEEQKAQSPGDSVQSLKLFPNPSTSSTSIEYCVSDVDCVSLKIYDIAGRLVRRLMEGQNMVTGMHRIIWNGNDDKGEEVYTGVYFAVLKVDEDIYTKKIVLLR